MPKTISEITKTYIQEMTLDEFASSLGIGASRQSVHQWKEGEHVPSVMTLFRVIAAPSSTPAAKAWAGECLSVYQQLGQALEGDLEKEIERRR